jgi:hypothetical protein
MRTTPRVIDISMVPDPDGKVVLMEDEWGTVCVRRLGNVSIQEYFEPEVEQYLYKHKIGPGTYTVTVTPVPDEITDETE